MNHMHASEHLRLEGEVTIYTAHPTWQRLRAALDNARIVEADLSGVSEFDSAGLQLLLMARAEALKADKCLLVVDASPCVREVFELCQLASLFLADSAGAGHA